MQEAASTVGGPGVGKGGKGPWRADEDKRKVMVEQGGVTA